MYKVKTVELPSPNFRIFPTFPATISHGKKNSPQTYKYMHIHMIFLHTQRVMFAFDDGNM